MKLTTTMQISVDGVVQGNGGPEENRSGGFERGGWARLPFDSEAMTFVDEWYQRADAFLFGRRTYELFAGYWGVRDDLENPIVGALNTKPKYVASNTLTEPRWADTTVLSGDLAVAIGSGHSCERGRRPGGLTRAHHEECARVVASLTRRFGDLDIAEEAAAEALAAAVERWPADGVPPSPGAWLTTTANRKAIDRIRRENKRDDKQKEAQLLYDDDPPEPVGAIEDDRLRLIFTCCHPALAMETAGDACREILRGRNSIRDASRLDLGLRTGDPLPNGGLLDQEGAGDLGHGQTGDHAQRQRHAARAKRRPAPMEYAPKVHPARRRTRPPLTTAVLVMNVRSACVPAGRRRRLPIGGPAPRAGR